MLEFTYYNTEKIDNLKDFFTVSFMLIDDVYNEIMPNSIKNRRNISESKLSDSEIITISIVGKALTIDSEKAWFYFVKKNFSDLFPNICVCKFGRAYFNKVFKDISTYNYCASKKETYFRLKLHALVTTDGFIYNRLSFNYC